ncbi:hypothetical protein SAQ01S_01940 [Sphingomonas aquatilis NBRC 16722]|nr:hypothetical protein SAQ01S_01940 [Sphingomonas aquatilis NBRC 16722]
MMRQIDADADDHRIATPLQQNARQFRAIDDHVVRPFEPSHSGWRQKNAQSIVESNGSRERQRRGRWIAGPETD